MSLSLKEYQKRSLASLKQFLERARVGTPDDAFAASVDDGLAIHYRPMPGLPAVPYVCLRIPTGGGKTVMGAHIIQAAAHAYLERTHPLVLWMVPTTTIKEQTLDAFRDARHPYRKELDAAFGGKVAVFDVTERNQIRPADLDGQVCLVISTMAALRVEDTEGRKVYEHHEDLEPHFVGALAHLPNLERGADGKALASFANLLRAHGPLVIMDEAHNATTSLSYTVYERLGPRAVVELTATPDLSSSNVLVSVSAFELKAEDMIKFPVVLKEHQAEWQVAVNEAVARRNALATLAAGESPDYIRPILLIQAENSRGVATVEEVKRHLTDNIGLSEASIAIATGDDRGLDGVDLFAPNCPIEAIITKQALKEGWDCSFAYVFCSVAQVKSSKDVQQLLGRVLRMPYATPRKQIEMSKAYAHVVAEGFGAAAGELTQSLLQIGFNPMEAATAIRRPPPDLGLTGGGMNSPTPPTTTVTLPKPPDLSGVPARDRDRIVIVPADAGTGVVVTITDELDDSTIAALVLTAPKAKRDDLATRLDLHQQAAVAAKAPSERGVVFSLPRLYQVEQGELELVDRGALAANFEWDLLAHTPDLSSFKFDAQSMTFEVDLDGTQVQFHRVADDTDTYLAGFAHEKTMADLIGWLDQEIRTIGVKQPVLREWVRRAVTALERRGFSLAQLLKGQFVLRRKLQEQLGAAKDAAYLQGFQHALFGGGLEVVTSDGPDHDFAYPADLSLYPARSYYRGAYRFEKHYYPFPGDLKWKTDSGAETEEFLCAQAIDLLDEVEVWCRNLVHPTQFWMPTSRMRTYPDFTARLNDGRLLVVEYKGGDRFTADQEREKRMVGELWAKRSGGKGLYLMAVKRDDQGRGVRDQLLAAISP